jgi:L-threonylcarbamoyladenylate synthase
VTGGTGTVGVRVPAHAVAQLLCEAAGTLLTATSANRSGHAPSPLPEVAVEGLEAYIAVLLDAGPAPGGPPSTIVDVTGDAPRLIRAGAIGWEEIERCLNAG